MQMNWKSALLFHSCAYIKNLSVYRLPEGKIVDAHDGLCTYAKTMSYLRDHPKNLMGRILG